MHTNKHPLLSFLTLAAIATATMPVAGCALILGAQTHDTMPKTYTSNTDPAMAAEVLAQARAGDQVGGYDLRDAFLAKDWQLERNEFGVVILRYRYFWVGGINPYNKEKCSYFYFVARQEPMGGGSWGPVDSNLAQGRWNMKCSASPVLAPISAEATKPAATPGATPAASTQPSA